MSIIDKIGEPYFLVDTTDNSLDYGEDRGFVVRKIRGKKCATVEAMMTEFGAVFQFFDGFGENWNALRELLCYMDEWLPGEGYVVVVTSPSALLEDDPEDYESLLKVLKRVGDWWSKPINDNEPFNRPARPFKVVMKADRRTAPIIKARIERYGCRAEIV